MSTNTPTNNTITNVLPENTGFLTKGTLYTYGNLLCAIDTETTGLDPLRHEIVEICILPLDTSFNYLKDIMPLHLKMRPDKPENVDYMAMTVNKATLASISKHGISQSEGADLFNKWFEKLGLPLERRITPLGHNYIAHDKLFISQWLGHLNYAACFHWHVRDTYATSIFLNDRCYYHDQKIHFKDFRLASLARALKVEHNELHTAIEDCLVTAECYKRMMTTVEGILPDFASVLPEAKNAK